MLVARDLSHIAPSACSLYLMISDFQAYIIWELGLLLIIWYERFIVCEMSSYHVRNLMSYSVSILPKYIIFICCMSRVPSELSIFFIYRVLSLVTKQWGLLSFWQWFHVYCWHQLTFVEVSNSFIDLFYVILLIKVGQLFYSILPPFPPIPWGLEGAAEWTFSSGTSIQARIPFLTSPIAYGAPRTQDHGGMRRVHYR